MIILEFISLGRHSIGPSLVWKLWNITNSNMYPLTPVSLASLPCFDGLRLTDDRGFSYCLNILSSSLIDSPLSTVPDCHRPGPSAPDSVLSSFNCLRFAVEILPQLDFAVSGIWVLSDRVIYYRHWSIGDIVEVVEPAVSRVLSGH